MQKPETFESSMINSFNHTQGDINHSQDDINQPHPDISESQLQAQCFQYAYNNFPQLRGLIFHVPNGGTRNKAEAAKLKALGVIPGIPDIICLYNNKPIAIEFKTSSGKLSKPQNTIHQIWRNNNIPIFICRSFQQWKNIINQILSHPTENT